MKISLIEFSVENFKIFKNRVTFSTSGRKSEHTFESNKRNLLKTSLVYGPNASGKSSLLDALHIMRTGIINSANNQSGDSLPYHRFLFSSEPENPIFWEAIFSLDDKVFKYNFSILKDKIVTENLFEILSNDEEKAYLIRNEQSIKLFGPLKSSKDVMDKTRKEVLFISAASQWNSKLALKIVDGFKNIHVISGIDDHYSGYTVKMFKENGEAKIEILDFLKKADFCIDDGVIQQVKVPDVVKKQMESMNIKKVPDVVDTVIFSHSKFDSTNKKVGAGQINISEESQGTQKFFSVLGPIIDTIKNGKVLLIDEFDSSLHPSLTKFILDVFEKRNQDNAQLIVTTHDTSLLSYKDEFNKEQFWFTEKDKMGVGNLFSLAEFELRNDTEFSKKYLEGRFGALPFIESM